MILYNICLCFPYVTDLLNMSKNIFSQAHSLGLSKKMVFWVRLLLYPISICIFCFPKDRSVRSSFYDTHFTCFSLETFYKTNCAVRK